MVEKMVQKMDDHLAVKQVPLMAVQMGVQMDFEMVALKVNLQGKSWVDNLVDQKVGSSAQQMVVWLVAQMVSKSVVDLVIHLELQLVDKLVEWMGSKKAESLDMMMVDTMVEKLVS